MSYIEKLKNWLSGQADVPLEKSVAIPDDIAATAKASLANRELSEKDLALVSRIIAQEPMVYADVRAVVEYYWGGVFGPEEYGLLGDKGDGKALRWWETKLAELEGPLLEGTKTSGFKVYTDNHGEKRWFGWVSNNWIDREKEIISAAAHKEFIQWLDANPDEAPELWSWHTNGTARKSRADWWDFANGFLVMSGPLTEDEAKAYENLGDRELGMSHGFYALKKFGPIILKYRTFEVSDLDREYAANPYTAIQVLGESKMFNPTKRAYLVSLFGEEKVAEIEGQTEDAEKALDKLGVARKEFDEKYVEYLEQEAQEKAEKDVEAQVGELLEQIKTALNVEQLRDVLQAFGADLEELKGVKSAVENLQAEVTALKATEDKRISSLFAPVQPINWATSPASKAEETVVEEDDLDENTRRDIQSGKEENYWLKGMSISR